MTQPMKKYYTAFLGKESLNKKFTSWGFIRVQFIWNRDYTVSLPENYTKLKRERIYKANLLKRVSNSRGSSNHAPCNPSLRLTKLFVEIYFVD